MNFFTDIIGINEYLVALESVETRHYIEVGTGHLRGRSCRLARCQEVSGSIPGCAMGMNYSKYGLDVSMLFLHFLHRMPIHCVAPPIVSVLLYMNT